MKFKDLIQHNISYPTFYESVVYRALAALLLPLFSLYLFYESYLRSPGLRFIYAFGDPDYGYLFNSLLILDGQSPWHIDHPGTPVQLVGALLMKLRFFLAGQETTLATDFFRHSAGYHRDLILVGFSVFFLSQWFCGWRLLRARVGLAAALMAQSVPFFFWATEEYFKHTSPEVWIAAFSLLLIPMLWQGEALAAGLLTGLILTLKIYSLPLVLVLFVLPRPRDWLVAFTACGYMVVMVCSIWLERLPRWLNWMTMLSTRTGNYGTGPAGQPSLDMLAGNLELLATSELNGLLLLLAVLIPLTAFYTVRNRGRARTPRYGIELVAGAALIFFAIRHYPVPRYLLPLLAPLGLFLARITVFPLSVRAVVPVVAAAVLGQGLPVKIRDLREGWASIEAQNVALETEIQKYPGCAYIFPDAAPVEPFALFSGHLATYGPYADELTALYPQYFLPGMNNVYRGYNHGEWTMPKLKERLAKFPCRVYFYNDPSEVNLPAPGPAPDLPPASRPPYRATPTFTIVHYVDTPLR